MNNLHKVHTRRHTLEVCLRDNGVRQRYNKTEMGAGVSRFT